MANGATTQVQAPGTAAQPAVATGQPEQPGQAAPKKGGKWKWILIIILALIIIGSLVYFFVS